MPGLSSCPPFAIYLICVQALTHFYATGSGYSLLSPSSWHSFGRSVRCPSDYSLSRIPFAISFANDFMVCRSSRQTALLGSQLQSFFAVELGLADELLDAIGEALRGTSVRARFSGRFGADQKRDFAAGGALPERAGEFGEFTAAELFMHLCDFARDAGAAIAKHLARVSDAQSDAVWR